MADTVRYLLEDSIPELEDLEKKGYFSRSEIKQIVQKRQDFEYLLKRRAALKQDYYRYIDYEAKLEELRRYRKQKLGIKGQKSLAEVAIVRRIHFIYERAARKFKADLELWLRWIELCKKLKSTKRLSKVVTKALQRHATTAILWIEAACWEFEHNSNAAAARALMQQGLRVCKDDPDLWVEYYRLELLYVHKLRARREVLGLDPTGVPPEQGTPHDEGQADGATESAAAVKAVLSGAVARVVYKNATAAIPGDLQVRERFLAALDAFTFEGVDALRQQVLDSIQTDFGQVAEAYDILARRSQPSAHTSTSTSSDLHQPSYRAACSVYEAGLVAVRSERMYELYSGYLCETLGRLLDGASNLQAAVTVAAELFEMLQRAHASNRASAQLYMTWIEWAEKVKQPKMALNAARKACERYAGSTSLWQRRLQLELGLRASQQHSAKELFATLSQALQATQPAEACSLWMMAVSALPAASEEFGSLCNMLEAAIVRHAVREATGGLGRVAAAAVQKTRDELGLEPCRALYKRLLGLPGAGGDLYRCVLQMEQETMQRAEASTGTCAAVDSKQQRRVTALYSSAVAAYGASEVDMWLGYAQWVAQCGHGPGQVYWRATKELADPEQFVKEYRALIGHPDQAGA